jgi:hypothetical protein
MHARTHAMVLVLAGGLLTLQAVQAQAPDAVARWGRPAATTSATRTFTLANDTRSVSVRHGETVLFVLGEHSFAWTFDGLATSFDLRSVAPDGLMSQSLMVYVVMEMQGGK